MSDYRRRKQAEIRDLHNDPDALTEHERLDVIEAQIVALEAAVAALGGELPVDDSEPKGRR